MRLNVCVLTAKQLLCTLNCDSLYHVYILTSTIITLSGITLCVFVGQHGSHCHHDRLRYDILGSDKLQISSLTCGFLLNCLADFRVIVFDKFHYLINHGLCLLFRKYPL